MTEIIIMVVARNLRQRRKKAGLTQKMVACLLGLESATICRMEKGHNAVQPEAPATVCGSVRLHGHRFFTAPASLAAGRTRLCPQAPLNPPISPSLP
ncbi:helix-turn-helix domain-containing protein [Desulfovibrio piger]|uniref:helix-turn-helix domain-containing protein n=1 Tax=Desulfovibrio piger TaxID=901 RepID=UPI0026ECEB94|nr:helix-turn-helix transcriptional regulator [Desulfovibrio piger]